MSGEYDEPIFIGKSKIKMIQSRHVELQAPPYSTRAGGARVYFQPFIEWLAKYEGKEAAEKMAKSRQSRLVTPVTPRLSGALLRELRLSVKAGILGPTDPRHILGLDTTPALPAPDESERFGFAATLSAETGVHPGIIRKAENAAAATAQAVIRRELAKDIADQAQGGLL